MIGLAGVIRRTGRLRRLVRLVGRQAADRIDPAFVIIGIAGYLMTTRTVVRDVIHFGSPLVEQRLSPTATVLIDEPFPAPTRPEAAIR